MDRFYEYLIEEERSSGTIEKYIRDVRLLQSWLGPAPVTKENAARWKQELLQSGRAPSTVNSAAPRNARLELRLTSSAD